PWWSVAFDSAKAELLGVLAAHRQAEYTEAHLVQSLVSEYDVSGLARALGIQRSTHGGVVQRVVVGAAHGQAVASPHRGQLLYGTLEEIAALPVEVPLRGVEQALLLAVGGRGRDLHILPDVVHVRSDHPHADRHGPGQRVPAVVQP